MGDLYTKFKKETIQLLERIPGVGEPVLKLAQKAVELSKRTGSTLGTLAAAYAETGDFDKAVQVQKEAIALVTRQETIEDFSTRLALYQDKKPYRQKRE